MKRFKDILCVVDPKKEGRSVLDRAVSLAENNQADLTLVSLVERIPPEDAIQDIGIDTKDLQAAVISAQKKQLEALVEPYQNLNISTKVLVGTPFLAIIREIIGNGRDLVIKLAESPSWFDRLFGSNDMHLLRKCPVPVWLMKPGATKSYRRVLAAVDVGSEYPPEELKSRLAINRQILELAASLALSEFAEWHVVHVWDAIGESLMQGAFMDIPDEKIRAYVEQVQRQHRRALDKLISDVVTHPEHKAMDYLKPNTHLVKGSPRKKIPVLAKEIDVDLVVMGTVARTGVPGFIMGNTAETILDQIGCSVLAVKPPGFVTPVKVAH